MSMGSAFGELAVDPVPGFWAGDDSGAFSDRPGERRTAGSGRVDERDC